MSRARASEKSLSGKGLSSAWWSHDSGAPAWTAMALALVNVRRACSHVRRDERRLWIFPRGPWDLSPGLHQDDRRAELYQSHDGVQLGVDADAESAFGVHRPREISDRAGGDRRGCRAGRRNP